MAQHRDCRFHHIAAAYVDAPFQYGARFGGQHEKLTGPRAGAAFPAAAAVFDKNSFRAACAALGAD